MRRGVLEQEGNAQGLNSFYRSKSQCQLLTTSYMHKSYSQNWTLRELYNPRPLSNLKPFSHQSSTTPSAANCSSSSATRTKATLHPIKRPHRAATKRIGFKAR